MAEGDQKTAAGGLLITAMLLVGVMASLDITIVSVALPYMQGSLGATSDEITWVLTMYTVSQAVSVALMGHFARLIGLRRLALTAVSVFALLSALCGMAQTLEQMVVFRFLQGFFGGPLIPLSQAVLVDRFPPEKRVQVLTLWTLGVMGGPVLGPVIGGYLSQEYSWTWNFFINLPVGALAFFLCQRTLEKRAPRKEYTDFSGIIYLSLFVVCLQVMLDQGDILDWFGSPAIVGLAIGAIVFLLAFLLNCQAKGPRAIVPLQLFRDVNFTTCNVLIFFIGCTFLGIFVVVPTLTVDLLGWEATTSGLVLFSSGTVAFCMAFLSSRTSKYVSFRMAVVIFAVANSFGWYWFSQLNLNVSPLELIATIAVIQGGMFFLFPRVTAQAFANVSPQQRNDASGLFNFVKTLGFSIGTSVISTFVYRANQGNWHAVGAFIEPANPGWNRYVEEAAAAGIEGETLMAVLGKSLDYHSQMLSIVQLGQWLAGLVLLTLLALLFVKKEKPA